ncbi:MAG: Hsp20/alpha crystallin family protein [Ignavibacteria bacterium]|nr:Hsp20/alpha crystallin family protein [Ignavibacteria bacterium]
MFVRFGFPRMFDDLLEDVVVRDFARVAPSFPAIDVAEHESEFVLVAEMPGVKKEDLKITFEDSILTLSGERKPYEIPQDARVLLNEVRVREFTRSVRMPSDIQVEKISAKLENGVLRIVLPKAESARIRNIEIK